MRKAHSEVVPPLGELLKKERLRRGQSQEAAGLELGLGQGRVQRWEAMLFDIEPDRDVHARLRAYIHLDKATYAQAALEHSLTVVERRK